MTSKLTPTDMKLAETQAIHKAEQPQALVTLTQYGQPRMSVTVQTDDYRHTWLRFSQESAELQAHLQGNGWVFSAKRRGGWHRVTDAQTEAFVTSLQGTPVTPKQAPAKKVTPTPKTTVEGATGTLTPAEAPAPKAKGTEYLSSLTDRQLAKLLAEVTAEIHARMTK